MKLNECIRICKIDFKGYLLIAFFFICSCFEGPKQDICVLEKGPCVKVIDSIEVLLSAEPLPLQAFKETTFIVQIKGKEVKPNEELILDLTMPGMYMGKNQVVLKRTVAEGEKGALRFTGKGIIPRCPSGKTLWEARVIIPERGTVAFRFHVKY
jgi:hypothetical protein